VYTAPSADVPPPVAEPPIVDPIVILSDENNGDSNGNTVEKMVIEEDELNAIGAEIAENLWELRSMYLRIPILNWDLNTPVKLLVSMILEYKS